MDLQTREIIQTQKSVSEFPLEKTFLTSKYFAWTSYDVYEAYSDYNHKTPYGFALYDIEKNCIRLHLSWSEDGYDAAGVFEGEIFFAGVSDRRKLSYRRGDQYIYGETDEWGKLGLF